MLENEKSGSDFAESVLAASLGSSSVGIEDDTTKENPSQYSEESEIARRFYPHKSVLYLLANSYERKGEGKRADRVRSCGSSLFFAHEIDGYGEVNPKGKLKLANFCRDRLCPMCNWRRSLKIFGQVSQIMDLIEKDYSFLFLTLTVPNVPGEDLSRTIDKMISALHRLFDRKRVKTVLRGYFRALEITYNVVRDDFHPHFHIILAVPKSYFTSRDYIKQAEWLDMWNQSYYGRGYQNKPVTQITSLDVRKIYDKRGNGSIGSAVAESSKYAVKSSDYLHGDNYELTDKLVGIFSLTLFHRRLAQFGGIFLDTFHKLGLEDVENDNSDLVHVNETINTTVDLLIRCFGWNVGISNYKFLGSYIQRGSENEN